MPSQKISQMPDNLPLVGGELIPIVQTAINKKSNVVQIAGFLFPQPINPGSVMWWDGLTFRWDVAMFRSTAGVLNLTKLIAQSLQVGALPATIDTLGKGTFLTLHAANGFTGSGAFTTFTFKDGIVTAAA
jgi:hypothetical protein